MGDFNINILNCDSDKETADFVEYCNSNYSNLKTLIDNIFYNDFTQKITAGNNKF